MRVDGAHRGEPIYVVGGGTSLKGFDFTRLNDKITIACNAVAFQFQSRYLAFFCNDFIKSNYDRIQSYPGFVLTRTLIAQGINRDDILYAKEWKGDREPLRDTDLTPLGISESYADGVSTGGNVGFFGLTLAHVMGGDPIYLLGMDMCFGNTGDKYFYKGYKDTNKGEQQYNKMIQAFEHAAPILEARGIKVYNCSKVSKLEGYEYYPLGDI